jgi:hypothetical protein
MGSKDMEHPLPFRTDPAPSVPTATRGRRPEFTDDPMLDRLYSVTLALVAELAVTRTRLDTVERLLARRAVLSDEEIEAYRADDAAEAEARGRLQAEYLERVFREFMPVTRGDLPR